MELEKRKKENLEFAIRIRDNQTIHISRATERGNLYKCVGCGKEIQAVLRHIKDAKSYFRHHPTDIPVIQRCTFKDDDYRKKLTLETLELEKIIKVPPLYKKPPSGTNGLAIPLLSGEFVTGDRVRRHVTFYENDEGEVNWTNSYNNEMGDLLFKAESVLFNKEDEPILLIQIGKKFGLSPTQFAGLKRIMIDTIQITIPKESPEEMHRALMTATRTKWIYNNYEQRVDYFSISDENRIGISDVDGDDDFFFEESFDCRKVQISNLIRAINRCLQTEQYVAIEKGFRAAVGEGNLNIRRLEQRRSELEDEIGERLDEQYREQFHLVAERRRATAGEIAGLERKRRELEERYIRKRRSIEEQGRLLESRIGEQEAILGGSGKTIESLQRNLEWETQRTINSIKTETAGVARNIGTRGNSITELQRKIAGLPTIFDELRRQETKNLDREEAIEDEEIRRIQTDQANLPERFRREEANMRTEFEREERAFTDAVEKRNPEGKFRLPGRFKGIISSGEFLGAIANAKADFRRVHIAHECYKKGTYKEWL